MSFIDPVLDPCKDFMRRRALKKYTYKGRTGFLPIDQIHSVAVVVDVTSPEFDELRKDVTLFFRQRGIKLDIYYLDFRKIENTELLLTSIQTTILKKEINWFGMPDHSKLDFITSNHVDLFVSLVPNDNFTATFICACAPARFKAGISTYDSDPFNMVMSGTESPVRCFNLLKDWLEKFI